MDESHSRAAAEPENEEIEEEIFESETLCSSKLPRSIIFGSPKYIEEMKAIEEKKKEIFQEEMERTVEMLSYLKQIVLELIEEDVVVDAYVELLNLFRKETKNEESENVKETKNEESDNEEEPESEVTKETKKRNKRQKKSINEEPENEEQNNNVWWVREQLKNLKIDLQLGECNKDFMQTDRDIGSIIYVNEKWIHEVKHVEEQGENIIGQHLFLLLVKLLHEVAHILTPTFIEKTTSSNQMRKQNCEQVITPQKIGTKYYSGIRKKGDAGFGFEECLLGGRLLQVHDKDNVFKLGGLCIGEYNCGEPLLHNKFKIVDNCFQKIDICIPDKFSKFTKLLKEKNQKVVDSSFDFHSLNEHVPQQVLSSPSELPSEEHASCLGGQSPECIIFLEKKEK